MAYEYAIAALLPEPLRSRIELLRRTYDRWSKSWLPPHITIVPPTQSMPERVISAQPLSYPIDVTIGGWHAFKNTKGEVMWLDPGQENSAQAQQALLRDYPELQPAIQSRIINNVFTFHITVVERIPVDQFSAVQKVLQQQHIVGTCRIQRLTMYRREHPGGQWQEQKS